MCVSDVIMSPLSATLKCPHERREDTDGAEGATSVASDEDGGGREDHRERGWKEDRSVAEFWKARDSTITTNRQFCQPLPKQFSESIRDARDTKI
jgi:hypothetical protein